MRQGQQSRRGRNRGGRKPQNSITRNYESSGPDVKIRGTAMHIAEKYSSLARDAMSSGDTVAAENYLQHAEHYNRIILAAQSAGLPGFEGQPPLNGGRFGQSDSYQRDYDGDSDDGDDGDYLPPQQPQRQIPERQIPERAAYNPNQPQPYIPQNAFPQIQPQPIAPANGAPGHGGEPYAGPQDGDRLPRRRRRRPIGELPLKALNGRNGNGAPHPGESGAPLPGDDSKPDE
ncbi:MAG: DUF4167 domain-containing protein [Rhodomicrobium sp.]